MVNLYFSLLITLTEESQCLKVIILCVGKTTVYTTCNFDRTVIVGAKTLCSPGMSC